MSKDFPPQHHNSAESERVEIEHFKDLTVRVLNEALKIYKELGEKGKVERDEKNRYEESSLEADFQLEEVIIQKFKELNLPIRIMSEEHGELRLGNQDSEYLLVLDGMDGSSNFKKGLPHCTMFALYKGKDPKFSDYLSGGLVDYQNNRIVYFAKNQGAWSEKNGEKIKINTSGQKHLTGNEVLPADIVFEQINSLKTGVVKFSSLGSSGMHLLAVAEGKVPAALEVTFKANLEISSAYGLVKETGGVVVDEAGKDIGDLKYSELPDPDKAGGKLDFTKKTDRKILTTAATPELALEIVSFSEKSRNYFYKFLHSRAELLKVPMAMHKEFGLHKNQRPGQAKDDWSNVSRHCVTEMVAADVLAEKMNLSEEDKKVLLQACFLHDFYKRKSIEIMRAATDKTTADVESQAKATEELVKNRIDQRVIDLLEKSLGYDSLDYMIEGQPGLLEQIMHYVDDIAVGEELSLLKDRVKVLKGRYPEIDREGISRWKKPTYDVQLEAGTVVEKALAQALNLTDHENLPLFIKNEIIKRIQQV